jgi:hypothetical protein
LGSSLSANVTLFNAAVTYGLTDRLEATINVPFSVVDASGAQTFLTFPPPFPPPQDTRIVAVPGDSPDIVQAALDAGVVGLRTLSFTALGADFNTGKQVGLGRVSVGVKGLILDHDWYSLAASAEFFCNSPSQDEYAGSDSASVLPRLIGKIRAAKHLNFHVDIGEEHDFQVDELSRFVWNAGVSIPIVNATFDFGMGGSYFDESIVSGPATATGSDGVTIMAVNPDDLVLGTNYVDFLFGMKMALIGGSVLSGAVGVPVTDDGIQPAAAGTVALEYYF